MAEMLADNLVTDDRRRVVGAGVRHGRDAHIADMRAIADLRNTNLTATHWLPAEGALSLRVSARTTIKCPSRFAQRC